MDHNRGVRQNFQNHTNMSKSQRIFAILITMVKITNDPKMLKLIEMIKKEVDKIKWERFCVGCLGINIGHLESTAVWGV